MIGRKEAVEAILSGNEVKSIIVVVGKPPDWFDAATQLGMHIPMVYTGIAKPKPGDCSFLKDQMVQLIHGQNTNDRTFASWYANVKKHNPKFLLSLDGEGEIYVG